VVADIIIPCYKPTNKNIPAQYRLVWENESGYRIVLVNRGLGTEEWSFRLQLTTNKNICYAPITPTVLIYLLIGSLALS
jgi:hypothetical protein